MNDGLHLSFSEKRTPLLWLLLLATLAGCDGSFGTGGTGERVIPTGQLRQIDATTMDRFTTRPTTGPSTQAIAATQPSEPPPQIELTIEECRQIALENNLDLKVDLLNPTIARTAVSEAQAQFESVFTTAVNYTTVDAPTASELNSSQAKDLNVTPGISIPLRTGGTVQLNGPIDRSETNNQFATLNPAYTSDLSASISLPLLRGAGTDVNSHAIRIAFYQYQEAEAGTKLEVIRVLAIVDRAYWRLDAARRELEVRKKEYDLAVAQFERAQRLVAAGQAADVEIVRAESGVADKVEAIIVAENAARDRQRELKRLLHRPGLEMDTPTIIVPASKPRPVFYKLDAQKLMAVALKQRMEMLQQELRIAEADSTVRFARNGMLPLVMLDYTYNINGLGPSLDDSLRMVRDKDFEDHRIGVRLEVPIGNEAARSQLRRALASRMQQTATQAQEEQQIRQEVLAAVDQLEANWQRILASQKRVILSARLLDAETRQFTLGLRTSTDVLNAQADLANAQSAEISAITEYQIGQVDIAFATGTLLGAARVVWEPIPAPAPR